MQPFRTLTSKVIPLAHNNIDTDQIIPARYLKVTNKEGLADGLFYEWRFDDDGQPDPNFPLNFDVYQQAQILVAGDNFGCGSSREHAPWALVGWGIRAVVSTSFADIFRNNSLKNGLLPVSVDFDTQEKIFAGIEKDPEMMMTIDLPTQTLTLADGSSVSFPIDTFSKTCLLEGVDQLGYILKRETMIEQYEQEKGF
ncbi:MAG: 3-isopropylmalate dehydratase small subunit [Chloroflexota bacterium]|nr:MAG: 3-isopropylmalate dehydratase small subunit [Chloroflexota bacterium]